MRARSVFLGRALLFNSRAFWRRGGGGGGGSEKGLNDLNKQALYMKYNYGSILWRSLSNSTCCCHLLGAALLCSAGDMDVDGIDAKCLS